MIKLFKPYVSWRAIWYVIKVLMSNQLAEGPMVKQFEKEFAKKFNLKNVVAVNSGTSALELAYDLAGIKEGDEVITPVLTCTATNIPLARRKAKIVFADIDYNLNINIKDVKNKITKKTKAIVFVHFGGNNNGFKECLQLGSQYGITIIEDAAQAVGSDFWGKADYTAVSLQAIKTLTSGDGGFLICRRKKDYEKAKRLRWFGYDRDKKQKLGDTDLKEAGYKFHMNDIIAAIGLGNLRSIDKVINHRKMLMEFYNQQLNPFWSNIWLTFGYSICYKSLKNYLKKEGVEVGQHHYRNDKYKIFGGRKKFKFMDKIENKYYFLPMHHGVSLKQAKRIVKLIRNFYAKI